jgi:hypothetical protein
VSALQVSALWDLVPTTNWAHSDEVVLPTRELTCSHSHPRAVPRAGGREGNHRSGQARSPTRLPIMATAIASLRLVSAITPRKLG